MWSSPGKKLQSPSMKPVRRLVISMLALGWIVPSSPRIAHAQEPSVNELLVLDNVTVVDVRTGKLEPDQTVILERHRIFSIRPRSEERRVGKEGRARRSANHEKTKTRGANKNRSK